MVMLKVSDLKEIISGLNDSDVLTFKEVDGGVEVEILQAAEEEEAQGCPPCGSCLTPCGKKLDS
jgi:hypothetical protein